MSESLPAEEQSERCWSMDGSDFSYSSLGDLLDSNAGGLEVGQVVYEADANRPLPSQLIDSDDVIEIIGCRGTDIGGEYADDFPAVTPEAKNELDELLHAWVAKYCEIRFYTVTNTREYVITAEDFGDE